MTNPHADDARTLGLSIDHDSAVPAFEQIRSGIATRVDDDSLHVGTRLPSIRALANDLGLASGTVAKAYRRLEDEGTIITRRGAGTRIADTHADPGAEARPHLDELTAHFIGRARGRGFTDEQITASVHRCLHAVDPRS